MFGLPDLPIDKIPDFKGLVSGGIDSGISFGGAALINTLFGNYWGIFNEYGVPLLLADNVLSLQYQNQSRVVNAPIESGSFTSYNKVADPYKATVQLSKGSGGALMRGAFLAQIETLAKSTLKFYIITPEYVYKSANIVGFDLARSATDGATLIKVNVHLEEIREVKVKYEVEEVKNPDDSKVADAGDKGSLSSDNPFLQSVTDMWTDIENSYSGTASTLKNISNGGKAIYDGLGKVYDALTNQVSGMKMITGQMTGDIF